MGLGSKSVAPQVILSFSQRNDTLYWFFINFLNRHKKKELNGNFVFVHMNFGYEEKFVESGQTQYKNMLVRNMHI